MLSRRDFLGGLFASLATAFIPKKSLGNNDQEYELVSVCGRCKKPIDINDSETCFYCGDILCFDCFDKYGHCGHPEADAINEKARDICQGDCSHCQVVGCDQRRCFAGIDDLINTGYQDERTGCICDWLDSFSDCDIKLNFGKCKYESEYTGLQIIIDNLESLYSQIKHNPGFSGKYVVGISQKMKQDVFSDIDSLILSGDELSIVVQDEFIDIHLANGGYSSDIWILKS